jgi:hypothetical protein
MAKRAAHDLPEHVAASFIQRKHTVVNQEGGGACVIGIDAQRNIDPLVLTGGHLEQFGRFFDDGAIRSVS